MALKNNRAPLLCHTKLCASFHYHMWTQTGVTVRTQLNWFFFFYLCDLDLCPLTLTFYMDIISVNGNNSWKFHDYYSDVTMSAMASQITGVSTIYATVCLGVDQRKHQSSASLAFVGGIHRSLVNSLHKGPVTRKMFAFDDVIVWYGDGNIVKKVCHTDAGRTDGLNHS